MKAIIMAAGESTRTYPLTITRPKPLLKIANKTILEHNMDELKGLVDEIILIVGYRKEMIMKHVGMKYKGMKVTYVTQQKPLGTGHALLQAKEYAGDRFIVLNGDDLYSGKDMKRLLKHQNAALVVHMSDASSFGIFVKRNNRIIDIIEKPKSKKSGLCNIGCYIFDHDVFDILKSLKKSPRGEYEITDLVRLITKKKEFRVEEIKDYWFPIGYPWDLLTANSHFLKGIKKEIKGKVERHVTIIGKVRIGKGTVVKEGSYLEGPIIIGENCVIGPHAYIRPDTTIGNNCKVRAEIFDAIIGDHSVAKHTSYVAHSVLGEDVNIGAGTVTADYRHDGKNHMTVVKGEKIDSGRRKLGSFMGDHVRTGIGTLIYPGRKLWPWTGTLPGEVVNKDKMTMELKAS